MIKLSYALVLSSLVLGGLSTPVQAQDVVYRCPGNTFTNALSAKVAAERGCKTIEGAPITVVHGNTSARPRVAAAPSPVRPVAARAEDLTKPVASGGGDGDNKVSANEQKARDSDARRILQSELSAEQEKLSALLRDYNNGQPERRGDERNAAKYQERIEEMRSAISRKEGDVSAIKREINKLPS